MPESYSFGMTIGHALEQSPQRVQASVTKRAFWRTKTRKSPGLPSTFSISASERISILGCRSTSDIFGASMQIEQSSVGKFLSRTAIIPPIVASFSTRTTRAPASARSSEACIPAIPPPTTSTESLILYALPLWHTHSPLQKRAYSQAQFWLLL